ncbi:MAG: hypothetical protein ABSG81_15705, partial [Acidimicrobiales bacterium]
MPLILGVVLLVTLGTFMLTQDTFQQFPIVTKDVIQHEAYRAMESGLDEYLYEVNANGDFAACNATFVTGGSSTTSTLTSSSSVCSSLSFGTWTSVPGTTSTAGPPAFFLIDNPSINTATGLLSIDIVGAAGYTNDYDYQTAVITLQPLNSFLLDVLWMNYDQEDPQVVQQYFGSDPTCKYYWASPNPNSLNSNCVNLEFAPTDSLTGNLFVNDSIWVCDSPTFQNVKTADTSQKWIQDCSGTPTYTSWVDNQPTEPIPTDNTTLEDLAQNNGCYYEGPTTITLMGTTMDVTSYGTPAGKPVGYGTGSVSNDSLNDPDNTANVCMPTS